MLADLPDALLRDALDHCARRVPLYRGLEPPDPALPAGEAARRALAGFPVLTKERLRGAFPLGLVPEGARLGESVKSGDVLFVGTSGTTSERVQVLWHPPWWAAQERDGFAPHPVAAAAVAAPDYREAVLATPVCSGTVCHVGRATMDDRTVEHTLFLNEKADPALWTDADVRRMADELDAFRPAALEADPAYLAFLAARLAALGRAPWRPTFIDLSYSLPSRIHLRAIAAAWPDVPIVDAYGSTECGFVYCQCPAGRSHPNLRWTLPELLPLAAPGLEGLARLVVTTLDNPWLNLVRFDSGDLVRPAPTSGAQAACACGRRDGPQLLRVEGRAADLLVAEGGRLVTPRAVDDALAAVDAAGGGLEGLLHFRLVQRGPRELELELVPRGPDARLDVGAAAAAVAALLGPTPRARVVRSVPPEASGKLRLCAATHVDAARLALAVPRATA